ncbi:GAK system CofD-like protein [Paraneptunicella aestuarii]|uniref:GAK system CofD-like protein n=1 Tax=Paraneptunicella aestuarii TaxID=2831148 RepID=UPI001E4D04C5|nr:GAK system CofD-like protein [Paraneptunicella aestuarii]UAA40250.1 GAK system CofD-like protein [Paraneptunicella aestuarii]
MHTVKRTIKIPDHVRLERYRKAPDLGPNVLFFTGGTAIHQFCRRLKNYTHNSTHLMTPFDSGGSSAELRKAFSMPAIGDLRARLMALADEGTKGMPEVYELFIYRLSKKAYQAELQQELDALIQGRHPLIAAVSEPMRQLIQQQLASFGKHKPDNFDLRGASIGNLILTGGYLNSDRQIDPIVYLFSKLVAVRGSVALTVEDNHHLVAELENGDTLIGQHLITGKEHPPINSPINNITLSHALNERHEVKSTISQDIQSKIEQAELICFPPGSFYSSLLANLMPTGVCDAIAVNGNPKVYVPNLGKDPESIGLTTEQSINKLLEFLNQNRSGRDAKSSPYNGMLTHVLLDQHDEYYTGNISTEKWQQSGIQIIRADLVSEEHLPSPSSNKHVPEKYDPEKLTQTLLSLV